MLGEEYIRNKVFPLAHKSDFICPSRASKHDFRDEWIFAENSEFKLSVLVDRQDDLLISLTDFYLAVHDETRYKELREQKRKEVRKEYVDRICAAFEKGFQEWSAHKKMELIQFLEAQDETK